MNLEKLCNIFISLSTNQQMENICFCIRFCFSKSPSNMKKKRIVTIYSFNAELKWHQKLQHTGHNNINQQPFNRELHIQFNFFLLFLPVLFCSVLFCVHAIQFELFSIVETQSKKNEKKKLTIRLAQHNLFIDIRLLSFKYTICFQI